MGLATILQAMLLGGVALVLALTLMDVHVDQLLTFKDARYKVENEVYKRNSELVYAGFNCTNLSDTVVNVTLYFLNTGSSDVNPACTDLYINKTRISPSNIGYHVRPQAFDPSLCNPGEVLLTSYVGELVVGQHNGSYVTCAGQHLHVQFNASKCPDGSCTGGEYCYLENSTCPDQVCYDPVCGPGCTLHPITSAEDPGECEASGTGCQTDECICDASSLCCGVSGSSGCSGGSDCCSGSCTATVCD